jgi:hypothetical protein
LPGWKNIYRKWNLLGETVGGTFAEFVSLPEQRVYLVPIDFDFPADASTSLIDEAAWHSRITRSNLCA